MRLSRADWRRCLHNAIQRFNKCAYALKPGRVHWSCYYVRTKWIIIPFSFINTGFNALRHSEGSHSSHKYTHNHVCGGYVHALKLAGLLRHLHTLYCLFFFVYLLKWVVKKNCCYYSSQCGRSQSYRQQATNRPILSHWMLLFCYCYWTDETTNVSYIRVNLSLKVLNDL